MKVNRIHPVNRVLLMAAETVVANWAWKNRSRLVDLATRKRPPVPDTSRPLGDRFIGAVAGPPPSPYEAAMAESAPALTPETEAQLIDSTKHVHIVPIA
jgi:hypothetical protein